MFSKAGLTAAGIICPSCKKTMVYDEQDNFYKCPQCRGQYWPNEPKVSCPGCGRAMKLNNIFSYYKCTSCGSEFWPPSEEEDETEEQKEDDPSTWKCSGRVYAGAYPGLKSNAVKPGGGSSGGKKVKKKPKRFIDKYAAT